MNQTNNTPKTAYELIRDAYRVLPSSDEDLAKSTATLKILVVEDRKQPIMLAPETVLTVDGMKKTATITGTDGQVTIPLSELWSILNQAAVLKRVRSASEAAYETAASNYADVLVGEIVADLKEKGREWNLPSVCGEDRIAMGVPQIAVRPKTLYLDNNDRLYVVGEDENNYEEYTELVSYPSLSIEAIKTLQELLDRPLDEE